MRAKFPGLQQLSAPLPRLRLPRKEHMSVACMPHPLSVGLCSGKMRTALTRLPSDAAASWRIGLLCA